MDFANIERSFEEISKSLEKFNVRREKLLKESRDVISLSAKATINIHAGKFKDARKNLSLAKIILSSLRRANRKDLTKYLIQPEAEYVEATVLYSIITKKTIPTHKMLNVASPAYLFGLLDVIGEIKRLIYDKIRIGKNKEALNLFDIMEKLYVLLAPLAAYDNIVQGFRRKLDVARKLIEDTRGVITEEIKREGYIKTIEKLSNKLK